MALPDDTPPEDSARAAGSSGGSAAARRDGDDGGARSVSTASASTTTTKGWVCGLPMWSAVLPVLLLTLASQSILFGFLPNLQNTQLGKNSFVIIGAATSVKGVLAMLASPMVGALADRYGRRPMMAASALVTASPFLVLCVSDNMYLYELLSALSGVCNASFFLAYAYIADATNPLDRTAAIGVAAGTAGASLALGSVLGDLVDKHWGFKGAAYTGAAMIGLVLLYIAFVVPESIHSRPVKRAAVTWSSINPLRFFKLIWRTKALTTLCLIVFFSNLSEQAVETMLMPYLNKRFHWHSYQVNNFMIAFGLLMAFSQMGVLRALIRCAGETTIVRLGLCFNAFHVTAYGVIWKGWMVYAITPLSVMTFVVLPAATALVSNSVSDRDQGAIQGAVNGVRSLTIAIGPLVFGEAMTVLTSNKHVPPQWSGSAFFGGSLAVFTALYFSFQLPKVRRGEAASGAPVEAASPRTGHGGGRGDAEAASLLDKSADAQKPDTMYA